MCRSLNRFGNSPRTIANASCGRAGSIFVPLENFLAQTKSCGAGCPIGPGANAGGGPALLRIHVAQREDVAMKHSDFPPFPQPFELDLDDLLHPAQAFAHPRDVVADADLTANEKRAVLASTPAPSKRRRRCATPLEPPARCRSTRFSKPSARSTRKRTIPPAEPCAVGARRSAGRSRRSGSDVVLPTRGARCRGNATD